jgi:hypothetical protein
MLPGIINSNWHTYQPQEGLAVNHVHLSVLYGTNITYYVVKAFATEESSIESIIEEKVAAIK